MGFFSNLFGGPKLPPPPDPKEVAAAQADLNKKTALQSQRGSMVNQVTPYGSLNYNQTGFDRNTGMPIYTATQSLSPQMQGLFDLGMDTQTGAAGAASNQMAGAQDMLSSPVDLSNRAVDDHLMKMNMDILSPYWDAERERFETDLANRGIKRGMESYTNANREYGDNRNRQLIQLLLSGRSQAVNEMLGGRNQTISEIANLRNLGQGRDPAWVNTPGTNVANTDYMGAAYQSNDIARENAMAKYNHNMGLADGLFSLGGTVLGGPIGGAIAGQISPFGGAAPSGYTAGEMKNLMAVM